MECLKPSVVSVKCHFEIEREIPMCPDYLKHYTSVGNNFFTVAYEAYRFTIFPTCRYVNVTGLSFFQEIVQAADTFENLFETRVIPESIKIDNSTAVGLFTPNTDTQNKNILDLYSIPIALKKAQSKRRKWKNCHVSVRPTVLPCVIVRRTKKPTTNIFPSGKYVILGAKTLKDIEETCLLLSDMGAHIQSNTSTKKIMTVSVGEWC